MPDCLANLKDAKMGGRAFRVGKTGQALGKTNFIPVQEKDSAVMQPAPLRDCVA